MARIRSIKPEFWLSLPVSRLSVHARLTFIGLWNYSDDYGRAINDARLIKAAVWPLDNQATPKRIETWMTEIATQGLIQRYVTDNTSYFQITNWSEHQRVDKPRGSAFPPAPVVDRSTTLPRTVADVSIPRARASGKGEERKGEERERRGEGSAPALEASRNLPEGLSGHPAVVLYWERFRPESVPAIITQEQIEATIGEDLAGWTETLDYWQSNGYRTGSIGKMLDRYREQLAENDPIESLHKKYAGPDYAPGGRYCPPLGMTQREWDKVWLEKQEAKDGEATGSNSSIRH